MFFLLRPKDLLYHSCAALLFVDFLECTSNKKQKKATLIQSNKYDH